MPCYGFEHKIIKKGYGVFMEIPKILSGLQNGIQDVQQTQQNQNTENIVNEIFADSTQSVLSEVALPNTDEAANKDILDALDNARSSEPIETIYMKVAPKENLKPILDPTGLLNDDEILAEYEKQREEDYGEILDEEYLEKNSDIKDLLMQIETGEKEMDAEYEQTGVTKYDIGGGYEVNVINTYNGKKYDELSDSEKQEVDDYYAKKAEAEKQGKEFREEPSFDENTEMRIKHKTSWMEVPGDGFNPEWVAMSESEYSKAELQPDETDSYAGFDDSGNLNKETSDEQRQIQKDTKEAVISHFSELMQQKADLGKKAGDIQREMLENSAE